MPAGVDVLRSALILCADHELNVSSFTARCVASAGVEPVHRRDRRPRGVGRHPAWRRQRSRRVDARIMARARHPGTAVAARLRRGETIDGFGHPLYRDGDPRAIALLDALRERYPKSRELSFVLDVTDAATAITRERPNLDFALASVARVLRLPAGSPLTLFAIGRTIGWIGQAIEQYATGQLIRPRAKYVGVVPQTRRPDRGTSTPNFQLPTSKGARPFGSWRLAVGIYSCRNAESGSTVDARRAGTQAARRAAHRGSMRQRGRRLARSASGQRAICVRGLST